MEREKDLIIPTQNISFAVLEDGEIIANDKTESGGVKAQFFIGLFKGIKKYIKEADEPSLFGFGLTWVLENEKIDSLIMERMSKFVEK